MAQETQRNNPNDSRAPRRRRLESAVAAIQQRHGPQAIRRAGDLVVAPPPAISTGFPALDAITGCHGIPQGDLTLFSGPNTSGKLTLAYKTLACAQAAPHANVVLLDLARTADPDYMRRCGIQLDRLLLARPEEPAHIVPLLLDIVQSGSARLLLVDGLPELLAQREAARALRAALGRLRTLARTARCAVLFVDEAGPAWQRWLQLDGAAALRQNVALHLLLAREEWLRRDGMLVGYRARAQVLRSRWRSTAGAPASAPLDIVFNGVVQARATW